MSTIVAVAGGSGGLGRAIVDALKEDGKYEVLIFSRKENPKLEKESGVRVIAADYANVDALVTLLEENKVTVVISTAHWLLDPTPELNMIQATTKSSVTKRFLPNTWSAVEFKHEPRFRDFPIATQRLQIQEQLKKSGLEWTVITPGFFMEIMVQGLPSYVSVDTAFVDTKHNVASLPNKGEAPITVTYSRDIATYVVKLLGLEKWELAYYIVGDTKTWNEIVAVAEAGKGVKFDVTYDSIEKLQAGQISELPGHEGIYELFGGREQAFSIVQGLLSQYALWMEDGVFAYQGGTLLNDLFPEVKPLNLEQAWKITGGKA